VINVSGRHRYAIPHFLDVHPDTMIECLPTCRSESNPPKYDPITYDAYALWYARRNYVHLTHEDAAG
jgi:isopenicillin N synthase-like dioxygenase